MPEGPVLCAQAIIDRSGAANLIVLLRVRMGFPAESFALAARPLLSVFNDAGVGRDAAGIAALAFLQDHGLAACTVAHDSARIGDAHSALDDGIISHVNAAAHALGIRIGQRCRPAIEPLTRP